MNKRGLVFTSMRQQPMNFVVRNVLVLPNIFKTSLNNPKPKDVVIAIGPCNS